jgi:hypothetical protein
MDVRPVADCLLQRLQPSASDDDGVAEVMEAVRERLADPAPAAVMRIVFPVVCMAISFKLVGSERW